MNVQQSSHGLRAVAQRSILNEAAFGRMISREKKRTERSGKPFLLMLLDMSEHLPSNVSGRSLRKILSTLPLTTRETDVTGWYKDNSIVGVIFTEIAEGDRSAILTTMTARMKAILRNYLDSHHLSHVGVSFHLFPERLEQKLPAMAASAALYSDYAARESVRNTAV